MGLEKVRDKETGRFAKKHGKRYSNLYKVWEGLRRRCNDPNALYYKNYGGRGISVCSEWNNDFLSFYNWAKENGYKEGLTIDRIDNNGNYEPFNCRWATPKEQANNRRNTPIVTLNGVTKTSREWDQYFGLRAGTVNQRMCRGMAADKALQSRMPNHKTRFITYKGMTMNIKQWADHLGIKYCTLIGRLATRKWTVERALSTPSINRG